MNFNNINWKKLGLTVLGLGLTMAGGLIESKSNDHKMKDLVDKAVSEKLSQSSTK